MLQECMHVFQPRGGPAYMDVVRLWVHVNIKASKTRSTALADFGSDNWFGSRVVCRVCKRLQVSYVSFWVRRDLGGYSGGD
ncbi:hypothetical protein Agabi119p4_6582 [Agaricus bisporus var. burnettii]|uniref:Uncharacterized protein n=1 Tax=Agaricus bisporus var. burnettii TaxID=192524 RepID=A0A8H7CAX1_AGABI|nr:hypothetical protein Agabi119p4_6582 [Agaricus bisporus var. burnettii]